jgi:formylglycine-generating enzyme required for sulfatase activity
MVNLLLVGVMTILSRYGVCLMTNFSVRPNNNDSPICDLHGNVWQRLSDDFNPFEGFEPHYLYTDYSKPYFNSEHKMMLGGSWATAGTQARGHLSQLVSS